MRKRIGEFLLEKGLINSQQLEEILRYSAKTGLRFGDAGLALKIYSRESLIRVFGENYTSDFFHLDPRYFPEATKDLLGIEQILALGALPLGFKKERRLFREKQILNLGLLNPRRADAVAVAEKAVRERFGEATIEGTQVFLILADQFLDVVRNVYGLQDSRLRDIDASKLDPVLAMYLDREPAAEAASPAP